MEAGSLRSPHARLRPVDGVAETDLELTLLDLLYRAPGVVEFLVSRAFDGRSAVEFIGAWRSLDPHSGAAPLTVIARLAGGGDAAILIEGRVSAPTLPRQSARQRERGAIGSGDGSWEQFATCLVAPRDYLECERVAGWDCLVAIEDLQPFAESTPGIVVSVLDAAIAQYRAWRNTPQNASVVAFFNAYSRLCEREYPDLRLYRPSLGRTDDAENWVQFADGFIQRAPTDVRLCHRPGLGQVEIEIAKAKPAEVRLFLEAVIPSGAAIERAGEATAIRFRVPVVDQKRSFAQQQGLVRAALDRARELLSFWMQHRARLGYGEAPY